LNSPHLHSMRPYGAYSWQATTVTPRLTVGRPQSGASKGKKIPTPLYFFLLLNSFNLSKSPSIKASFLTADHFLICRSRFLAFASHAKLSKRYRRKGDCISCFLRTKKIQMPPKERGSSGLIASQCSACLAELFLKIPRLQDPPPQEYFLQTSPSTTPTGTLMLRNQAGRPSLPRLFRDANAAVSWIFLWGSGS
jgi:hypothetical protein